MKIEPVIPEMGLKGRSPAKPDASNLLGRIWGRVLDFGLILWVVRVPLASVVLGLLLMSAVTQAQDVTLDVAMAGAPVGAAAGLSRTMMRRRSGRIISITSIVGVTGNAGQGNYAAAKAGMIGMSKSLAQEVASRGVTVNCVAPGFIATPMTDALNDKQRESILKAVPAAKLGTPEDIAAACVYLASNEAAYVTGQTLHVNGGMAMI